MSVFKGCIGCSCSNCAEVTSQLQAYIVPSSGISSLHLSTLQQNFIGLHWPLLNFTKITKTALAIDYTLNYSRLL